MRLLCGAGDSCTAPMQHIVVLGWLQACMQGLIEAAWHREGCESQQPAQTRSMSSVLGAQQPSSECPWLAQHDALQA